MPYQMNQTEQIASTQVQQHSSDVAKASFAPASQLASRINIDFKKLQNFKGRLPRSSF